MRLAIRNRASIFLVSLIAGISSSAAAAPVAVDGWRYVEGPNELHVYVCSRSDCVPGSRVTFYFDPPNSATFPGIWWKHEVAVTALLGEPSKTFSPLASDLLMRRWHKIATSADGSKPFYALGGVDDPKWRASVTSASRDEKASQANLEQFEAALRPVGN